MQIDLGLRFPVRIFIALSILASLFGQPPRASAQANAGLVAARLQQHLQSEAVVAEQLRHFMTAHVPPLRLPPDAAQWTAEIERLRARELAVIYHGWPQSWIEAPAKFEEVGTLDGRGYRIRKLRYEVVP